MLTPGPVAVLVGLPGSGKSTVGAALARRLGVEFRDVDADIESQAGKSISDIFIDDGEQAFRDKEAIAVRAALRDHRGVLALGGGALLREETRLALVGHRVVYLRVDLSHAVQRVGLAHNRPVLALNPRATLRELAELRRPLYEQAAMYTVDTSGRSVDQVATEIADTLSRDGETVQ